MDDLIILKKYVYWQDLNVKYKYDWNIVFKFVYMNICKYVLYFFLEFLVIDCYFELSYFIIDFKMDFYLD